MSTNLNKGQGYQLPMSYRNPPGATPYNIPISALHSGIDIFNKSVIMRVISELKNEHETGGISSMANYGGLGSFGGINDDADSNGGLGGLINDEEASMHDTLKQLQHLWENKFLNLCTQAKAVAEQKKAMRSSSYANAYNSYNSSLGQMSQSRNY